MDKYDTYKQELIRELLNKKIDGFYLIDKVIHLKIKIAELEKIVEGTQRDD